MKTKWIALLGCVALAMVMARPAQADFSATNYAGCILWLDANDLDGDGVVEGNSESGLVAGKVDRWRDKSGYGREAVQSTDADRPTYTLNALNGKAWVDFPWRKDMWITNAVRPQTAATLFMVVNPISVLFPDGWGSL